MSTGRLLWGLRWEQIIYTCFAHAFALIVGYKKQPRYNLRWMSDKGHEDVMASKQKSKCFSELKKMKKQLINRLSSTRSGYLEMYCSKKLREDLNNLMFELMGWFFLVSTDCCHVIFYSTNYAEYGTKDFQQEYFIQQNQMFEVFVCC